MINILELISVSSKVPREIEYNKGSMKTWSHDVDLEVLGKLTGTKVKVKGGNLYFNNKRVVHVKCCQKTIDFTTVASIDRDTLQDLVKDIIKDSWVDTGEDASELSLGRISCNSYGFIISLINKSGNTMGLYLGPEDGEKYLSFKSGIEDLLGIRYREIITGNIIGTLPNQMDKVYRFRISNGSVRLDHKVKFIETKEI